VIRGRNLRGIHNQPDASVHHFVYCDRELRLETVSTVLAQKQNPLILAGCRGYSW